MTLSVLFVCLGNICRSPMTEALMRTKVRNAGLADAIVVDSAGTGDWHIGEPPHHGTRTVLQRHGISDTGLQARQIGARDLVHFDYVIVMDAENERNVKALAGGFARPGQVRRLLEFAGPARMNGIRDVPDPYFTGGFEEVYELVESGCDGLLDYLVKTHDLTLASG